MTRIAALMIVLGLLAGTVTTLDAAAAPQAPKKDDKKATGKDDKKENKAEKKDDKSALGKIEIYKGKKGFRWRIVDANDKTIAMPTANLSWETKEEVEKALDGLKETLNKVKPVESKE